MEIPVMISFQGATVPSSGSMNKICDTNKINKAVRVMRLGATHSGINFSKYSANGDQIF